MTSMLVPSIALQGQMPTGDWGSPPMTGWAKLVPELLVSDIAASTAFWCDRLGFAIAYQRPEQLFVYFERPEGAQLMLCQRSGRTAPSAVQPRRHVPGLRREHRADLVDQI